jgi:hypothetical protein
MALANCCPILGKTTLTAIGLGVLAFAAKKSVPIAIAGVTIFALAWAYKKFCHKVRVKETRTNLFDKPVEQHAAQGR